MPVLVKPIITERSLKLVEDSNEYTFVVDRSSGKFQIKQAIEETYGVKVRDVRTKITAGKAKRRGKTRREVQGADLKYAIVKLNEKDKIDVFEIKNEPKKTKSKNKEQK